MRRRGAIRLMKSAKKWAKPVTKTNPDWRDDVYIVSEEGLGMAAGESAPFRIPGRPSGPVYGSSR